MIPITVHVPNHRVDEFYIRFGEFTANVSLPEAPIRLPSGVVPAWIQDENALELATKLWSEVSLPGASLLKILVHDVEDETVYWTPDELATAFGHPQGKSRVAGVLGGIGKAIRRAGMPIYTTPFETPWHYIWDWDREHYSMTPEVAQLLRRARISRNVS